MQRRVQLAPRCSIWPESYILHKNMIGLHLSSSRVSHKCNLAHSDEAQDPYAFIRITVCVNESDVFTPDVLPGLARPRLQLIGGLCT